MNKAFLLLDIPESCIECCQSTCDRDGMYCIPMAEKEIPIGERENKPNWCPLKPIPEEKPENHTGDYEDTINEG